MSSATLPVHERSRRAQQQVAFRNGLLKRRPQRNFYLEKKWPQRTASRASKPALRPTPTPLNVSFGATVHRTRFQQFCPRVFFP